MQGHHLALVVGSLLVFTASGTHAGLNPTGAAEGGAVQDVRQRQPAEETPERRAVPREEASREAAPREAQPADADRTPEAAQRRAVPRGEQPSQRQPDARQRQAEPRRESPRRQEIPPRYRVVPRARYFPPIDVRFGYYYHPYFGFYYGPYYGPYYPYAGPVVGPVRYAGSAIRTRVKPVEAEVYLNGYYAGHVDDFDGTFQRLYLPPGEHDVTLRLDGHESYHRAIPCSRRSTSSGPVSWPGAHVRTGTEAPDVRRLN